MGIPKISISETAYRKMVALTKATDDEVMAYIVVNGLTVEDIIVLKQEAGSASAEIDTKVISKMMTELIKNGHEKVIKNIKGTFHSHNDMGCYWSWVDVENIENLLKGTQNNYVISIVSSKANGNIVLLCRLDIRIGNETISYEEIPFNIGFTENNKWDKWAKDEIKKKVKEIKFAYYPHEYGLPFYAKEEKWKTKKKGKKQDYEDDDDYYAHGMEELRRGYG